MIGQLGSGSIAAIGLGGKFIGLLSTVIQAIAAVAGIIMAQAIGKQDKEEVRRGLYTNLLFALSLAVGFTALGMLIPTYIMAIYSEDRAMVQIAAEYLSVYAISFLPMTLTSILSAYLRCLKETKMPLVAGICSAVLNTGLNYVLIYGKLGAPELGATGAAWASVIAQIVGCIIVLLTVVCKKYTLPVAIYRNRYQWPFYQSFLLHVLRCISVFST